MWKAILVISIIVMLIDLLYVVFPLIDGCRYQWIIWWTIIVIASIGIVASIGMIESNNRKAELVATLCKTLDGKYGGGYCVKDGKILELPEVQK